MTAVIQVKRGTAAAWTSANTVLAAGEIGFETDTKKMKVGDGSTAWTSLGYTATDGDISGVIAGTGLSGGGTSGSVTVSLDTTSQYVVPSQSTHSGKYLTTDGTTSSWGTVDLSGYAPKNLTLNAQTGTTYTFVLDDNSKLVTASNGSAQTYSIPTNASVAFPVGAQINIIQIGAGQVTINAVTSGTTTVASTGATAAAPKLRAQYSSATLIKVATDTWYVVGDIS
jgi:hypothetical protein